MVVQLIQNLVWILQKWWINGPSKTIWMVVQLATNTVQMVSPCVYKTNGHFWKWKFWMVSNGLSVGGLNMFLKWPLTISHDMVLMPRSDCAITVPACQKLMRLCKNLKLKYFNFSMQNVWTKSLIDTMAVNLIDFIKVTMSKYKEKKEKNQV